MRTCIFCQITAKKAPASLVYEDDRMLCFMDIRPVNDGACMVIPKQHIDHFTDLDDSLAADMMVLAQRIGRNIQREFSPQRIGYVVHGYGVAHAHLNIVPQHDANDIAVGKTAVVKDDQVVFDHTRLALQDPAMLEVAALRIRL